MQRAETTDRKLKVLFVLTSMPVGGAETLLVNLVRGMNRARFLPEIVCLKEPGPLGEELAREVPVHSRLIRNKYDLLVLYRLWRLFRRRQADAVVTVGAGDKMFWGRLAAYFSRAPVILSALHSTGWPDSVGRLNRLLTPITDGFIGVARSHAKHLAERERFPAQRVFTIPNGIDTERFCPRDKIAVRRSMGIPVEAEVIGILAALRPEKNHRLFLEGAARILQQRPSAHFVVVGDGPLRGDIEQHAAQLGIEKVTHFLGSRNDVPELLSALDLLALTSDNEASPVSILEALSCRVPVVASDVGSVRESVMDGNTGKLFPAGDVESFVAACTGLLADVDTRTSFGRAGRSLVVGKWSLDAMVQGYESLISRIWYSKQSRSPIWNHIISFLTSKTESKSA